MEAKPAILSRRAHTVAVLRLVMTVAMCAMSLPRFASLDEVTLSLLGLYVLTSLLLFLRPVERQLSRLPQTLLFTLDLSMVVLLMHLSGNTGSEFYIMFFLIILMAALARSASAAAAIAFVSAVLYGLITGIDQPGDLLEIEFTTRISFFFVAALFAGYLAEEVQKEREGHQHFKGFYRTLFEEAAHGILVGGADGVVTEANSRARNLLGADPVGKPWNESIGVGDLATPEESPSAAASPESVFRVEIARPDLEPVLCEVTRKEFTVKGARYALLILRDVGSTIRMQDRILELEKMSVLGKLVSSITHEINNPLTAVLGWAEMMDDPGAPPEIRQAARSIGEAGRHCKEVVEGTLSHFRSRSLESRDVPLAEVIRAVTSLMEFHVSYHLVKMDIKIEGAPVVRGDARQLEQLLINLMCNSVQAMKGRSVRRLQVRVSSESGEARIEVSDSGPGIPEEHLRRLFQPGFTTKSKSEGHGLGLSLSREIAERHGGKISVTSRVGVGTRFTILLPLASGPRTEAAPGLAEARPPGAR